MNLVIYGNDFLEPIKTIDMNPLCQIKSVFTVDQEKKCVILSKIEIQIVAL